MEGHRHALRASWASSDQGLPRRGPVRRVGGLPLVPLGASVASDLPRRHGRVLVSS